MFIYYFSNENAPHCASWLSKAEPHAPTAKLVIPEGRPRVSTGNCPPPGAFSIEKEYSINSK